MREAVPLLNIGGGGGFRELDLVVVKNVARDFSDFLKYFRFFPF